MVDISNLNLIARGRTADVFEWDDGQVLKLFHDWVSFEDILYEQMVGSEIHASGIKSPAVGNIIKIDGHNGLLYEHIDGQQMFKVMLQKPWSVFKCAHILAELHIQMHEQVLSVQIPPQHEKLTRKLNQAKILPSSIRDSLIERLNSMPVDDRICHGDFHPANVLLSEDGGFIIDWVDTTQGNPLMDVARTSILMKGLIFTRQIPNWYLRFLSLLFHTAYVGYYFRIRPQSKEAYQSWLPIVAGARLSENIPGLENWLLEQARKL